MTEEKKTPEFLEMHAAMARMLSGGAWPRREAEFLDALTKYIDHRVEIKLTETIEALADRIELASGIRS